MNPLQGYSEDMQPNGCIFIADKSCGKEPYDQQISPGWKPFEMTNFQQ